MSALTTVKRGLRDLVFPAQCLLCEVEGGRSGELPLCSSCQNALTADHHETCPRCSSTVGPHLDLTDGCPRCRDLPLKFDRAIRLGPYDGRLRDAVLAIKHLAGESLAECLGRLWARERRSQFEALSTQLLVPIPLHWLRFWERGYNQAEALSWGIAAELGIRCEPRLLRRVRSTPMQTALSVDARRQNVAKSFRVSRWKTAKDLRILLIDDVLTTGSTASAAADALRQAGAAQVDVAVLAHR